MTLAGNSKIVTESLVWSFYTMPKFHQESLPCLFCTVKQPPIQITCSGAKFQTSDQSRRYKVEKGILQTNNLVVWQVYGSEQEKKKEELFYWPPHPAQGLTQ